MNRQNKGEISKEGIVKLDNIKASNTEEKSNNKTVIKKQGKKILGDIKLTNVSKDFVISIYKYRFSKSKPALLIGSNTKKYSIPNIMINYQDISPCHATIYCKTGIFYLRNESLDAYTGLNGQEVASKHSIPLPNEGKIKVGQMELDYQLQVDNILKQKSPEKNILTFSKNGFVIGEFFLQNLDNLENKPHHCEIFSDSSQFMIGRSPHCDYQIKFKEKYVANEQASIVYSIHDQSFIVKGLIKENPIFVNDNQVNDYCKIENNDVIRLGIAKNAPKLRFLTEDKAQNIKKSNAISGIIDPLERGRTYFIGSTNECDIIIEHPDINGIIIKFKVPERGNHLLITKETNLNITINGTQLQENESRALSLHQTLEVDKFYSLFHDQQNFIEQVIPQDYLFSEVISKPKRGNIYTIGKDKDCDFVIDDTDAPGLLAEIEVPPEGEYFLVKKLVNSNVTVKIDDDILVSNSHNDYWYGVNQVLTIGNYFRIRNNHRTLPPPVYSSPYKKIFAITFLCLFFTLLALILGMGAKKFWNQFNIFISQQSKIKEYQKNVFYIAVFDEQGKNISSGTGFLMPQKDAYDKDIYYLFTCKHVIQPWKFKKHKANQTIKSYIAVWPYKNQAISIKENNYLLENSFSNLSMESKLGDVEIYKVGKDIYQKLDKGYEQHTKRSKNDIAVLKLIPIKKDWDYPYYHWKFSDQKPLDVGKKVIVTGYLLGGGRLLNKNGIVVPASCEGKLASDYTGDMNSFLEIDVNQTSGASGAPIIYNGEIIGMITFSDKDKKLVYGIHSYNFIKLVK